MYELVVIGALVWLIVAIFTYLGLRMLILGTRRSAARSMLFSLCAATIAAPGVLSLGEAVTILPGGGILGLLYLPYRIRGTDTEGLAVINFASWGATTLAITLIELVRSRHAAWAWVRNLPRAARAGLSNREPAWIIVAVLSFAIPTACLINVPVGEPLQLRARVIACAPTPHWLTRIDYQACAAELDDGSIHLFPETDYRVYGTIVTVVRSQRLLFGTHTTVRKSPPAQAPQNPR